MSKRVGAGVEFTRYLKQEELEAIRDAVEEVWRTIRGHRNRVEEAERPK